MCMYGSFVAQLIVLIMFGTMKFFLVQYFFCIWSLTNKENEMKECRLGGQRSGNVVRVGILKDEMAVEVPLKPNHQST